MLSSHSRSNIQSGIPWDGGAVSDCGDAVNPSLGAWPRHPCRGHPAIRHHPASDSFPVSGRSTPCVDESPSKSNISTIERRSTHGVDHRVDQGRHLPGAGHAIPTDRGNLSKAGWVRLRGCPRHGCRGQAYRDVLAASPATGPTPPSHGMPAVDVAVALASAGAGRSPAGNPNLNSLFCVRSHPSARLCGSAAAVRFPPGSPATGVRPIARPHSDAVRHAFQPALRVGCTQFSQRGSRERSESADQFDLPPSVRSDRR